MCHTVALPFYIKKYVKANEELWKFKYVFHYAKHIYNLQLNLLKKTENHPNPVKALFINHTTYSQNIQ